MTTTFGNSNGGGDDKGGGGMSRAAKKRLKKKQKAQAQALAQEQQQQQQQLQARSKSKKEKKRKSSADGDDVDDEAKKANDRNSSSKKMRLLESDDEDDGDQPSDDDMRIAEVSKGELDYLESQGVKVTKKKKKKKNKSKKKADDSEDDGDDSSYRDDDGDAVDATEEEREEKEILLSLAQNLTPSQILFPGGDNDDDDDDNDEDAPEHGGAMMDPRRILQDLTSTSRARVLFESLLAPSGISADEFYHSYWEKKPLLIAKPKVSFATDGGGGSGKAGASQDHKTRLDNILSKKDIETMMAKCSLRYGRELNVTRYADAGDGSKTKRRITLDLPPKRVKKKSGKSGSNGQEEDVQPVVADPKDVWANFASGCTVRLLCPHLHSDSVHSLLSTLELEFGCMVGSNAYLTPGGDSQGFAPHYDDIEAFILQLEGRKRWRVYPPPNKAETLPRFSSRDYTEGDMEGTAPVIDTVLEPGDILYMPRGWIHQAHTPPSRGGQGDGGHSLHLTASAMQQWAWADLLDIIMPEALEAATASETSTSLREGLPRNFVNYMGAMYDTSNDDDAPEGLKQADAAKRDEMDEDEYEELVRQRKMKRMQDKFREEANKRIMRVCKEAMAMVNAGCDQIGKRFLSDRQPPALTPNEAVLTSEHREENGGKIWPNTMCRLARPGIARLVLEDDKAVLYHCADNSRVYHGTPLSPLEFEVDDAPALEMLLTTTEPHWICVKDLIHGDIEDKMEIAQSLYDEGILAILQSDRPDRSVQTG